MVVGQPLGRLVDFLDWIVFKWYWHLQFANPVFKTHRKHIEYSHLCGELEHT